MKRSEASIFPHPSESKDGVDCTRETCYEIKAGIKASVIVNKAC